MNFKINILLFTNNDNLYHEICDSFEKEDIVVLKQTEVVDTVLKKNRVYLVIIDSDIDFAEEAIILSKSDDLFRPILIFGDLNTEERRRLLSMGVNGIIREKYIYELYIQSINMITLYQAKRNSKSQQDVLKTLSLSLEIRDQYTHGHGERMATYSTQLYDSLGFKDYEEREALRVGSIIHDIGKIGTPDNILKSDKRLDLHEFEIIKDHPTNGSRICLNIISDRRIIDLVQHHHEKLDGSGYPHGLKGDEIGYLVQILTVCDIYDALTSDRSYRQKNSSEQALDIMKEHFVDRGKINKDYFNMFKDLVKTDYFNSLKYI
jgi:putative nucleotidyltransferase with HDIG domain